MMVSSMLMLDGERSSLAGAAGFVPFLGCAGTCSTVGVQEVSVSSPSTGFQYTSDRAMWPESTTSAVVFALPVSPGQGSGVV